jgi:nitroreductase
MSDTSRAAAVLDVIRGRRSVPKLKPDPVPHELVARLLDAAVWAPNHRVTEPWQFFVLEGESKRRFAEIRRDARRKAMPPSRTSLRDAQASPNPDAPEVRTALDKVYRDAVETPLIIAVTSHMPDDPEMREEDIWATYGAAYAFMLGAWAEGLGTYFRTGAIRDDPALRRLLGLPDNRRVIGLVYAGYPVDVPTRRRTPAAEKTVWLR